LTQKKGEEKVLEKDIEAKAKGEIESIEEAVDENSSEEMEQENDRKDNIQEMDVDIRKLSNMNIRDLYTLAKKYKITGFTRMRKNELVFAIFTSSSKKFWLLF